MDLLTGALIFLAGIGSALLLKPLSLLSSIWWDNWCSIDMNSEALSSETLLDAVLVLNARDGKILYADRRASRFYGRSPEEMKGRYYTELMGIGEKKMSFIPGESFRETHYDVQGNELPVEVSSKMVIYKMRNAIFVAIRSARDNTEKEREAEVRKAAIDATYNGIGIIRKEEKDFLLVDANPALVRILEMPSERMIGTSFFKLLPDQEDRKVIEGRIMEGEGWKGEIRVDDGRDERWFFISIDPMEESNYFALVCQDITEKRTADTRLIDAIVQTQHQERKRMATDLHDGVGQTLTAANVYLKTMEKKWEKGQVEEGMEHLPTVTDLLNKSVEEIRNISHDLMPNTLKEYGLIRALRRMIGEMQEGAEKSKIVFNTPLSPEKKWNEEVEGTMYRIAQEILNNTLRHSEADELIMTLRESDDELILESRDNGKGFDPKRLSEQEGQGLEGIKERATAVHGRAVIDSAPGKGTSFRVSLPLKTEHLEWEKSTPLA